MSEYVVTGVQTDRRGLIRSAGSAAVLGAALGNGAAIAAAPTAAPVPALVPLFTAFVRLLPPIEYGVTGGVRKRLIPISGGVFKGERMKGEVLPGGGDWQDVAPDGSANILARYSLRTHDGTIIGVSNPGLRNGPPAVLKKLAAGEPVDPSQYYFRTAPTFTVQDGPYDWLRKSLFICSGVRRANDVEIVYYVVT